MTHKIHKDSYEKIVLLEKAGWLHREIGVLYGVSKQSIGKILDRNRTKFPPRENEEAILNRLATLRMRHFDELTP